MALRPKQQRDTLDQTRATKSSIVVVRIAVITKKKRHKKVSIVVVLYTATVVCHERVYLLQWVYEAL